MTIYRIRWANGCSIDTSSIADIRRLLNEIRNLGPAEVTMRTTEARIWTPFAIEHAEPEPAAA